MTSTADPTGTQYELRGPDGRATASVTQVGASLRGFTVDGVDLVPRYPLGTPAPAASGVVLVPWPGRVRDGRWTQRGETRQLAITEPQTGNASHGLLRFGAYTAIAQDEASVTLAATVFPQTGYPFQLDTEVTYAISGMTLMATHRITNVGTSDAPVALGTHPYLCIGDVSTADLEVRGSGATRFFFDDQKIPISQGPVDAATDLRGGRRVGDVDLDMAYSSLEREVDGLVRTSLTAPDGRRLTLWQGEGFDYLQVFTTDRYPGQPLSIAIEPMTAPGEALNSGLGLRWLTPGETWELQWGLLFEDAAAARP